MIVTITTTETVEEMVDVKLPAFRRFGDNFYMIEDERHYIQVTTYDHTKGINRDENGQRVLSLLQEVDRYLEISQSEFIEAYQDAFDSIVKHNIVLI